MKVQLISVATILAVVIGCPETLDETAVDVAQAHEEPAQDVNEARRDANEAVADAESNAVVRVVRMSLEGAATEARNSYISIANATAIRDVARESAPSTFTTRTPAVMWPGL